MKKLLLSWVLLAVSVFAASLITQAVGLGFRTKVESFADAGVLLVGVALLSFLNVTLGRILKLLTVPLSCATLGLFSLVINALVLWLAASFQLGFAITEEGFQGFLAALVAAILISLISGALGIFLRDDKDD